jgi:hypothetical protein
MAVRMIFRGSSTRIKFHCQEDTHSKKVLEAKCKSLELREAVGTHVLLLLALGSRGTNALWFVWSPASSPQPRPSRTTL